MLLGGCCEDERKAPLELKEALPPTLESLTFYDHEGLNFDKTLGRQLQGSITDINVLPRLNCVALESKLAKLVDDDLKWDHTRGEPAEPPHTKVEQACKERGVMYKTKPASKCTKGGHGGQYYRYVRVSRARAGTRRWLRNSLKLYLEKTQRLGSRLS